MRYELIAFESAHIDLMRPLHWFGESVSYLSEYSYDGRIIMNTFMFNNQPAAIVGGFEIHSGVHQVFSVMSELIYRNVFDFSRQCLRLVHNYANTVSAHRIQMYVRTDYKKAIRFADFLGFNKEGLMVNFGPDKMDYFLYARTKWQ